MAELPGGKYEDAYIEIMKARRARLEEALSAASMVASETKPEIAAENHTLARETGLPPEVVAQDPEAVKMKRRADSWALLGSKNPSVAKWLLTADNAQLAQNDIKPIGALTSLFDTMRAVPEGLIGQTFGSGTSGVGRVHGILDRNVPDVMKQGADALLGTTGAGMVSKLFGGPSASDLYAKVSPGLQSLGKTLEDVGRAIGPPEERRTWAAEVGAGLGQILGYVAAGPASPVLMFGQGVEIMGDRVDAFEKENGPLGNLQLSKALPGQEPKEGDIVDSGIPMGDVAMLGGGVVTAVSEKLSMNWLLRKLPQGVRTTLMTRIGDIASSAGAEAAQEAVENIMHNAVAKLAVDPNTELFNWDEILQESGTAAASAAIFRALLGVKRGRSASDQAATDINTLDQMVEQSRIAQLRTLAPDRFEELLRQMQADGQQNIYMPAEEFQRYWQTAQQNDQTLAKTMNVPLDDYLTALATKGEIGVPLDKYLSMMPDSHDTLREKIRFRPGGLTIEEANDPELVEERANVVAARFMKSATSIEKAARQEIYDDVLEQFRNTGRFGESDIEAYASLFSTMMVTTAKRAGVDPVQLYRERGLKIMSSLPGPLADVAPQLDSMIERLKAGEVVSIEGEDDASLQLKYAMDTLAEEINRRNISLDLPTAQIRGMLTGDPRATSTEILGQLGPERSPPYHRFTKGAADTGVGYAMFAEDEDSVAGYGDRHYTFDPSDVAETEVISAAELRDEIARVFAEMDEKGTMPVGYENLADALADESNPDSIVTSAGLWDAPELVSIVWDRILDPKGIKAVTTNDGAIVFDMNTVRDAQIEQRLYQRGVDQTQTPEFKAWFGESKVLDAEGKPLVVYHGSQTDIGAFSQEGATAAIGFEPLFDGSSYWFTASPENASGYAVLRRPRTWDLVHKKTGEILERLETRDEARRYLAAEVGAPEGYTIRRSSVAQPNVMPVFLRMENPLVVDAGGADFYTIPFEGREASTEDLVWRARERGHDGLIVRNVIDRIRVDDSGAMPTSDTFVVFEGTQIKSAIGNRGTFDSSPNILYQMENVLSGKEKVPTFSRLDDVVAWIADRAKSDRVVDPETDLMSSKGRAEAVDQIAKHTLLELKAWTKLKGDYRSFYGEDIEAHTNPLITEYVLEKYGRKPTKDEISLIHLLSAFGSGQSTPTVDTQHGLTVFDEWMKKGEVTGYADKPKPVYKAFTKGESPKRVYIDSVTGEDTQVAAGNEPKFDHEKRAQVSKTYNVTGLARFMQIHKALGEDLHKTVTWLGTKHSFEDIQKVIGVDAAKKLKPHEYLDKNGQSFGVFALGNNPKLGSYILNRWGNFGTITKDMWVARTMSRYFDEANTGEPWLLTKVDLNKRKILEEAWNIVAKRLKVKPAEVQEMMWDAEKKIYARFGQTSEGAYSSSGVELALSRLRDQRARDGATDQEGTGKAGLAERFQQLFQSAFHGSPYKFSKFTLDHIGKGEGAQAFGWGLYFAGKRAIAEFYREKLTGYQNTSSGLAQFHARGLAKALLDAEDVAAGRAITGQYAESSGQPWINDLTDSDIEQYVGEIEEDFNFADLDLGALESALTAIAPDKEGSPGQLYEVNIPDDADLLQWDKPLSEQPEKVREALEKLRGTHVAVDTALDKPNVTTGAGFYKTLSAALGDTNGEKASPALNDVGIPGISYPAESLSGGKGDSRNYVIFDDSTIEILNTFYQGLAQPRGLIRWTQDRQFTIELLENANLSTFLHETGHFFLEVMGDLAADPNVEQGIKDDYAKILNWFGAYANSGGALNEIEATTREIKARLSAATPGTDQHKELANALAIHEAALATARNGGPRFMQEVAETFGGNVQDQRIRGVLVTPFHEMFARGFEAYLHSGKAPSAEVAGIFTRFSAWLKTLYRNLTELNVNLTPEVVGVFDRMVASEEEIEMARGEMGYEAVFKNAQMAGWSKAKFDQYLKDIEETESAEEARLLSVLMSEVQREKSAWWKEQSAKVQKEVEKDVYSRPEYQVLAYLKNGTQADGSPLPDGMVAQKLDKAWLEARYGQAFLNKNLLRKRVYAVTDGVDPEVVADMFGYDSADAMIDAIVNAKDIDAVVRHETRQRMLAEHGDMLNDGSAAEEAMRAVHSDRRMQVFYSEYETLAKLAGETPMSVTGLRRAAEIVVAGQKVRNLTPTNYLRAERRAGKAALKAAGNGKMAEALLEKRNQLINAHLYDVARKANVEAEKIRNFVKRFEKTTVKQRLGLVGRLDAVQMILDQYDLRRISGKQIDRNKVRNDLFEAIKSGQIIAAPEIANKLLRDTGRTNWRDLTVAELRGLKDVLAQMDKEARAEYEVWVLGEKRKVDDAAGEMAAQVVGNGKLLVLPRGKETKEESAKRALSSLVSSWRRPGSLARVLDGEDWGAVTRQLIAPIRRAVTEKLEPMRVEAGLKIQEIYSRYYTKEELDKEMSERFFVKSLGVSLSKFDLLNLAQNWGSDGNREAIVKGEALGNPNFTEDGVMQAFQDHLTAKDWGFVQDSVDMINSYWGEIEAANKRRKGIAPKKVDALPFAVRTKDGEVVNVKGGYFPLKYDRGLEGKSRAHEIDENFQDLVAGRTASAMTKAGHNIERVGSGGRPVQMSINVWHNHIDHVIRDLALTDTVIWADKLIRHKDFRSAMIETGNTEVLNTLELWLKDVAGGELAPRGIESVSAFLRINFTLAKIGFNMNTMLLQVTGLPQTAVVVGRQWFAAGAREYAKNPRQAIRGAMEQSEFMRLRYELSSFNKDIQFVRDFIRGKVGDTSGKGGLAKALKIIEMARIKPQWVEYAFLGIKYAQLQVDTLTWWAGYHKGVTLKQLSHSEAVQYADTVVENAQTSGMFSDRAGLERGTVRADVRQAELVKVWTTLGSYMLAKGNIASESFMRNDMKSVGGIGNFLLDMFLLFLPEFVLYSLLKGNEPDEDESWWWWLTKGSVEQMAATIPIVREIPSAAKGFSTGGVIGATVSDVGRVLNQTAQGELDLALIKAYVNLIGTATGLPAAQTNRAIDYAVREYQGEEANPMEIIVGKQAK